MAKICNGYVRIEAISSSFSSFQGSKVSSRYPDYQRHFLDSCFFCNRRLDCNDDIFMYKGEMGFCSEECREEYMEIEEMKGRRRSKKVKVHTINDVVSSGKTNNSVVNITVSTTGAVVA